jgi:hypothetical protein
VLLLSFIILIAPVAAQDYRGQIIGKVLDPSGAIIPNASVVITNVATNSSTATRADEG